MADNAKGNNENRDPITGEPGAHPLGTGLGAASMGTAGAAAGSVVGGPIGAAIGAAVGAVAGGFVGRNAAEHVDPTVENDYWRENYTTRPYVRADAPYSVYEPAYRYGWESRARATNRRYREVEAELERGWESAKGTTTLAWEEAKHAVKDAWHRVNSDPSL